MNHQKENSVTVSVYIGLGSNLDGPVDQLNRAITELAELPETELVSRSSLYHSKPMGGMDQPDYVNAVARIDTTLAAEELLKELQMIEAAHGRVREKRWGARTLDLDLLLYGSTIIDTPDLQVPHPGVGEREFVLYPLYEIAPELEIPDLGAISDLINKCPSDGLEKL
jgi:2-amino-4-hydroxy-6-hydroxymethyldihydropteridine diphosphokinase